VIAAGDSADKVPAQSAAGVERDFEISKAVPGTKGGMDALPMFAFTAGCGEYCQRLSVAALTRAAV
jgi:hypothetical protein